ncbi:transposase [Streptomyces sp. NBC_01481]|uniref:transposase n=1 Tax=Streptomyces sp. NBC_01481 TaxID=2975869 RepID=UPI00338F4467
MAWLSTTPLTWRKNIRHVAIDMSSTYRAAIRTGPPDAVIVVDHFHVVQLANKMLSRSAGAPPPRSAAGADGPRTRSGRPGVGCSATART